MVTKRDSLQNTKHSKSGVVFSKINLVSTTKQSRSKNLRQVINLEEIKSLNLKLQNFKGNPLRDYILISKIKDVVQKVQRMIAEVVLKDNLNYRKQNKKVEITPLFNNHLKIVLKDLVYSKAFRILAIYNVRSNKGSTTPGVDNIKFYKEKVIKFTYTGSKITVEGENDIGFKYKEFTAKAKEVFTKYKMASK